MYPLLLSEAPFQQGGLHSEYFWKVQVGHDLNQVIFHYTIGVVQVKK